MFINKDLVSGIEVLMFLRANGEVGFDACPVVGTARWPDREGARREGGLESTLSPLISPVPGCPGATWLVTLRSKGGALPVRDCTGGDFLGSERVSILSPAV